METIEQILAGFRSDLPSGSRAPCLSFWVRISIR